MKSLHVIPEIPAVVIWDRAKKTAETFEVTLQELHELRATIDDALSVNFPAGIQRKTG